VSSLIHRGWGDLRGACQAYSLHDPTAVLFAAQQAPEKYLKAMILIDDPTITEGDLRNKKYGHDISNLLRNCVRIDSDFDRFSEYVHLLGYGPNIRYHCDAISTTKVVAITNLAHALCHAVAKRLLSLNP
jgi:hypothetical protein